MANEHRVHSWSSLEYPGRSRHILVPEEQLTMSDLKLLVHQIMDDAGRDAPSTWKSTLRLREDLGFDSLELAVLTVRVEAVFGVDVFADGVVQTVGEIEDKIAANSSKAPE